MTPLDHFGGPENTNWGHLGIMGLGYILCVNRYKGKTHTYPTDCVFIFSAEWVRVRISPSWSTSPTVVKKWLPSHLCLELPQLAIFDEKKCVNTLSLKSSLCGFFVVLQVPPKHWGNSTGESQTIAFLKLSIFFPTQKNCLGLVFISRNFLMAWENILLFSKAHLFWMFSKMIYKFGGNV